MIDYQPVTGSTWSFAGTAAMALGAPGGVQDSVPLGYSPSASAASGGAIVLGFGFSGAPYCVTNGDGADFVVYSSATNLNGSGLETWNQVLFVAVSQNGANWRTFPYQLDPSQPLQSTSRYPNNLGGVRATVGSGPNAQGGDPFDLSDLPLLPSDFEACYVRITDAGTQLQDYGGTQSDPGHLGGAVDAVRTLHRQPRPGTAP